jgi:hypothetical protein
MASSKGYEVLVEELTVHQSVNKLPQADGSYKYQHGLGKTFIQGEVLSEEQVAEDWREALDSGEGSLYEALKNKLKPVGDEPSEDIVTRLGLPFEGYDDMDANDIVRAMSVLPSATIMRIKQYESTKDEPRTEIVDYSIGFGEHPDERQLAEIDEDAMELNDNKPVRRLTTREVPDEGPVVHGEGFTGTGEPQKPYGVEKDAEEGDEEAKTARKSSKGRGNVRAARRGRRERQPQPPKSSGESGGSLESENG